LTPHNSLPTNAGKPIIGAKAMQDCSTPLGHHRFLVKQGDSIHCPFMVDKGIYRDARYGIATVPANHRLKRM
jgi:hypothetical protein